MSNLEIWDYLTAENLFTGPTYDVEMIADFEMSDPAQSSTGDVDREDLQRCVTGCYGMFHSICFILFFFSKSLKSKKKESLISFFIIAL